MFDEKRVFEPGPLPGPVTFRGVRLGLPICEDIWGVDVVECLAETGAEILLSPNGSPYRRGVIDERMGVAVPRVVESGLPLVYLNQVGGQDELVFDGASFVLNADASLAAQLPAFGETVALVDFAREGGAWRCVSAPLALIEETDEADYAACVLGLRGYVEKNGFRSVVLGLSGGIDSAICAAMAVDALGADRVRCLMMPYRYTSQDSLNDAFECARALGVSYEIVPIAPIVAGFEAALAPLFAGRPADITEENLQSRARGTVLMSVSNKFGPMVITTGNKSEMSVGYCTLYGDMNGGFNPIKDLYKMEVYRLSALRNRWKPRGALGPDGVVIPTGILSKAPTAELRENQTDQDSRRPIRARRHARLPRRARDAAERHRARGHDFATVRKVERLPLPGGVQAPPVSPRREGDEARSFGATGVTPLSNRFAIPANALCAGGRQPRPQGASASTSSTSDALARGDA